jgi:hypothetical protein
MNVGTLLYKQYTHFVTDDLKIDTETSYVRVLLQVLLQVSLHVSLHASLHTSLRHTEWALQVAPRMSVDTLTSISSRCNKDEIKIDDDENRWFSTAEDDRGATLC